MIRAVFFLFCVFFFVPQWGAHAEGTLIDAAPRLVTEPINDGQLITLPGNTRPEANAANDRGAVPADLPMDHLLLQLRRSSEQEGALVTLIDRLHDPSSPQFHHWLSANEFGTRFGLAEPDLRAITGWLKGHGFRVNAVYPNRTVIDFSGRRARCARRFIPRSTALASKAGRISAT